MTGQIQGYAFITFTDKEAVVRAITGMNGQTIGDKQIKVNFVLPTGARDMPPGAPTGPGVENDSVDDNAGMRLNAQSRLELMQKLASAGNVQMQIPDPAAFLPQMPMPPPGMAPPYVPSVLGPPSPQPTPCLLLRVRGLCVGRFVAHLFEFLIWICMGMINV